MSALREDVQLAGAVVAAHLDVKTGAALDPLLITVSTDNESRRGVFVDSDLRRKLIGIIVIDLVGGIDQNTEIRNDIFMVEFRIGLVGLLTVPCDGHRGKVPSGGKPENAHFIGIDFPLFSLVSDHSDRTVQILEWRVVLFEFIAAWDPIFQKPGGHADGIEPLADLFPFVRVGENVVAAPGADNEGGPVRFRSRIPGQSRLADVGNDLDLEVSFELKILFGKLEVSSTGNTFGP